MTHDEMIELWRAAVYPHVGAATFAEMLADETAEGWDKVRLEIATLEKIAALRAPAVTGEAERAWLIECHRESVLHYWTGRVIGGVDKGQWSHNIDLARRFARREDAECMLTWHLAGNGRVAEHLWPAPVASPPAVTGEAARPAKTDAMLAQKVERLHQFIYSASGSGENEAHATIREVLALLASLAAPPAAVAPPALVAIVQRWQESAKASMADPRSWPYQGEVAMRHAADEEALLAWSPAPAPVAPPRCAEFADNHALYDPSAVAQARDEMVEQLDQSGFFRPRPPAVAGGDAPEIQVGDWVCQWGGSVHKADNDQAVDYWTERVERISEIRGERHGQPFIWRRRQEGQ